MFHFALQKAILYAWSSVFSLTCFRKLTYCLGITEDFKLNDLLHLLFKCAFSLHNGKDYVLYDLPLMPHKLGLHSIIYATETDSL